MSEDAELDNLFDDVEDAAPPKDKEEAEGEEEEREEGDVERMDEGEDEVPEREEAQDIGEIPEMEKLKDGAYVSYVSLPASIMIDSRPYKAEAFKAMSQNKKYAGDDRVLYPWRVVRWRKGRGADGEIGMESNARLVTWEDGSQHLFIGNKTAYELTDRAVPRGLNDAFSMLNNNVLTHFSALDKRTAFRLAKEPQKLRQKLASSKSRKVKVVDVMSEKMEREAIAEEDRKRSQSHLQRQKERKQRQASSTNLEKSFLEDAGYRTSNKRVAERYEEDEGFVVDDELNDGGDGPGSGRKRNRNVKEDEILKAKLGTTKKVKEVVQDDDDLELYDEEDSFINDNDSEGDGDGGIIDSNDI